jgi:hypothetical protein
VNEERSAYGHVRQAASRPKSGRFQGREASVLAKTQSEGFGVIRENCEPWVADLNARIEMLQTRVKELKGVTDFDTDRYRQQTTDCY